MGEKGARHPCRNSIYSAATIVVADATSQLQRVLPYAIHGTPDPGPSSQSHHNLAEPSHTPLFYVLHTGLPLPSLEYTQANIARSDKQMNTSWHITLRPTRTMMLQQVLATG